MSNRHLNDEDLDILSLWLEERILSGLQRMEHKMSELDDAVARIEGDVAQVAPALQALRDEIAALGNTGADVTRLNAAADSLEGALAPPATP